MGNGVPNQGPWQHRQGGVGIVGYRFRYHDQMVTGGATVESPEITPTAYGALRAAAVLGQIAFNGAISSSGWSVFFGMYTGISLAEARLGVMDLA
jgi:hypothetical protein